VYEAILPDSVGWTATSQPHHLTEGTAEHGALADKMGFSYRTLLGELLYAYITCRPDIGYAVTTLSKFATSAAAFHYASLKSVARYLRRTIDWGIVFHKSTPDPTIYSKLL